MYFEYNARVIRTNNMDVLIACSYKKNLVK